MSTSNWIATIALAVSIANTAFFLGVPWWRSRSANFEVRYRIVPTPSRASQAEEEQILLRNHGPAVAEGVSFTPLSGTDVVNEVGYIHPPTSVAMLAGQTLHFVLAPSLATPTINAIELRWTDKRGEHVETVQINRYYTT